jgi:predicted DNA-binding transcriptional regulator
MIDLILPEGRSLELSQELLKGAIDIHVHAGPHIFSSPRRVDPVQAAVAARDAGMRAIVFMDVFEMSNGTAWLVNRVVPNFKTYGGLIMNTVYGGMNVRAVKTAIHYGDGAKFISFGAHSTYFQAAREGRTIDGKFVPLSQLYPKFKTEELDRAVRIPIDGDPGPELDEILRLIADNPIIYMITGHVSVEEAIRAVDLAREYGIKKVLVSSAVTKIAAMEQLKEMVKKGAFIEYTLAAYTHTTPIPKTHYYVEREYASIDEGMQERQEGPGGVRLVAEQIKKLGADHCIIATDFGVYTLPEPVEGLREFIACLLDTGTPVDDIRKVVKTGAERLLGLQ